MLKRKGICGCWVLRREVSHPHQGLSSNISGAPREYASSVQLHVANPRIQALLGCGLLEGLASETTDIVVSP